MKNDWRIGKWREKTITQRTYRQIERECENERVFIIRTNNWFIAYNSFLLRCNYFANHVYVFYDSITIIIVVIIRLAVIWYVQVCVWVWVLESCPFVILRMIEILHETKNSSILVRLSNPLRYSPPPNQSTPNPSNVADTIGKNFSFIVNYYYVHIFRGKV